RSPRSCSRTRSDAASSITICRWFEAYRNTRRRVRARSEEHTSELQSLTNLVCRLLLAKKKEELRRVMEPPAAAQLRLSVRGLVERHHGAGDVNLIALGHLSPLLSRRHMDLQV